MSEGTAAAPTPSPKEVHYQRPGLNSITPYIIVRPAARFIEFLKSAFAGVDRMRMPAPDGSIMHADVAIGNGAVEVSDGNAEYPTAPAAIHLYVDDANAHTNARCEQGRHRSIRWGIIHRAIFKVRSRISSATTGTSRSQAATGLRGRKACLRCSPICTSAKPTR